MVQFLSIIFFFLDFFNFCWVFQKFPFFCVTLYIVNSKVCSKICAYTTHILEHGENKSDLPTYIYFLINRTRWPQLIGNHKLWTIVTVANTEIAVIETRNNRVRRSDATRLQAALICCELRSLWWRNAYCDSNRRLLLHWCWDWLVTDCLPDACRSTVSESRWPMKCFVGECSLIERSTSCLEKPWHVFLLIHF